MSFHPNQYGDYSQNLNSSSMQFEQFQYNASLGSRPFQPPNFQNTYVDSFTSSGSHDTFEDEPPLLEELGINFSHIKKKTLIVLNPFISTDKEVVEDTDLAGPLVFGLLFGATLLLAGKIHFNYIYGIGVLGCIAMYALLSMMAVTGVSVLCVISILGYCLLPMSLLSIVSTLLTMKSLVGVIMTFVVVLWCSLSASNLFVTALNMEHQQILVAYPCSLVYGVFALLSVF